MTVGEACEAYLREMRTRGLRRSTVAGYRSLFRALRAHATANGVETLRAFDRGALLGWREGWTLAASTHRVRLGQLKAFFSHAAREGWIDESPADGIKSPRVNSRGS